MFLVQFPLMIGLGTGAIMFVTQALSAKTSGHYNVFGKSCFVAPATEHRFELTAVHELAHVAQAQTGAMSCLFKHNAFLEGQAIATERLYANNLGTCQTTHRWHVLTDAAWYAASFCQQAQKHSKKRLPGDTIDFVTRNYEGDAEWKYALGSVAFAVAEMKHGPDVARLALEAPFEVFGR